MKTPGTFLLLALWSGGVSAQELFTRDSDTLWFPAKRITVYAKKGPINWDDWKDKYKFDKAGNVIFYTGYHKKSMAVEHYYTYNEKGLKTMEWVVVPQNPVQNRLTCWRYRYDAAGRIAEMYTYSDSLLQHPETFVNNYQYDAGGKVLSRVEYTWLPNKKDSSFNAKTIWYRNEKGRNIVTLVITENNNARFYRNSYNNAGFVDTVYEHVDVPNFSGTIPDIKEATGVVSKAVAKHSFDYETDAKGNWVKRYITVNGKRTLDSVRKIIY